LQSLFRSVTKAIKRVADKFKSKMADLWKAAKEKWKNRRRKKHDGQPAQPKEPNPIDVWADDGGALEQGSQVAPTPHDSQGATAHEAPQGRTQGEAPKRRGGTQEFKSSQQRKQLERFKNGLKRKLKGKQREAFKKEIEDTKIGEQFLDKETLQQIFDDIIENVRP
jgi:hypothetical protein